MPDPRAATTSPPDRLLERMLIERRAKWESQKKRRGKYKEPVAPDTSELPELPEGWVWATVEQLVLRSEYGTSIKCTYDGQGPYLSSEYLILPQAKLT